MREFNLDLSKINDLSEALVKKNEALNVYEKKITMYEIGENFEKRIVCLSYSEVDSIEGYMSALNPCMWFIVTKFQNFGQQCGIKVISSYI
ncbi:hypothetical protein LUQ84_000791 [Hamiltosporidium tvaerminnensis]|nr:hypothetical protein LUQ84_000791 [Hamiltosporidium tvaerminnensis]